MKSAVKWLTVFSLAQVCGCGIRITGGKSFTNSSVPQTSDATQSCKLQPPSVSPATSPMQFTWVAGANVSNQNSPGSPGSRFGAMQWVDKNKNLYVFGGSQSSPGYEFRNLYNDLWKWDGNRWIFLSGYTAPANLSGSLSGAIGPGARAFGATWIDDSGNLYLYGGQGMDVNGANGPLADLWMFNPRSGWSFVMGSTTAGTGNYSSSTSIRPVYGGKLVSEPTNTPGQRLGAASFVVKGSMYLFGGSDRQYDNSAVCPDLWMLDPVGKTWTWVAGAACYGASTTPPHGDDFAGVFGQRGIPNSAIGTYSGTNVHYDGAPTALGVTYPPARAYASVATDTCGDVYLFGGFGGGFLNDLWKFDGVNWTWLGGRQTPDAIAYYGTNLLTNSYNMPGGRLGAALFVDAQGSVWVYGGTGYDSKPHKMGNDDIGEGPLSDWWKFDAAAQNWAWVGGPHTVGQLGNYPPSYGISGASYYPGGREDMNYFVDANGNFEIFGGAETAQDYGQQTLNDVWVTVPGRTMPGPDPAPMIGVLSNQSGFEKVTVTTSKFVQNTACTVTTCLAHDSNGNCKMTNCSWDLVPTQIQQTSVTLPRVLYTFTPTNSVAHQGQTYYIAMTGNDSNPGTKNAPWATFANLEVFPPIVLAGDVVYVRKGNYTGGINLGNLVGTKAQPIVVSSYPLGLPDSDPTPLPAAPGATYSATYPAQEVGEQVRIYQTDAYAQGNTCGITVELFKSQNLYFHGFIIDGGMGNNVQLTAAPQCGGEGTSGITTMGEGDHVLNNTSSRHFHCGIKGPGWGFEHFVVEGNVVFDNGLTGLDHGYYDPDNHNVVRGNAFIGNSSYGIHNYSYFGHPVDISVYNNVSFSNGTGYVTRGSITTVANNVVAKNGRGLSLYSETDTHDDIYANNIVYNNSPYAVDGGGHADNIEYNLIYPQTMQSSPPALNLNGTIGYNSPSVSDDNIYAEPLFVDEANNDFRLTQSSPGIGVAGTSTLSFQSTYSGTFPDWDITYTFIPYLVPSQPILLNGVLGQPSSIGLFNPIGAYTEPSW